MSMIDRLLAFIGTSLPSCAQEKLLWTNPNPNTPVSTLTIKLNLSGYEKIMVICNVGQGMESRRLPAVVTQVGGSGCVLMYGGSYRLFTTSKDKIYFDYATHAERCIPYYIYGIKTVGGGID